MPEHFLKETRMMSDIPDVQEYRDLYARALNAVQVYNGTEDSYNSVTEILISLEQKTRSFQLAPSLSIPKQDQITADIFLPYSKDSQADIIGNLLDIAAAADSVRRVIQEALREGGQETESSPLYVRRVEGVILPPADHPTVLPGEGDFEPARFEERLFELTRILAREKIFLDDCMVAIGLVMRTQMRRVSYALVEIPRINRAVLVCDQVGEATFVVHGLRDPDRYLSLEKEHLKNDPTVRRIVRRTPQQWHSDLGIYLFTEEAWQAAAQNALLPAPPIQSTPRQKIDVRLFANIRAAVLHSPYHTVDVWMRMTGKEARGIVFESLGGMNLFDIAKSCGVHGNPMNDRLSRLQLACNLLEMTRGS
ncbi:hypothetical protein HY621_00780 [Candidatus Uhrbacteria bacterium]|nr:hypothetical protein [Candidatus Uhrbacteria bacterium]